MRRFLGVLALVVLGGLVVLVAANAVIATIRDHPVDADRLSDQDLALVARSAALRERYGDLVWPGFASATVAALVYNDAWEFLLSDDLPTGWQPAGDPAAAYGRRTAERPQAFAIDLGGTWAGSLPVRERMDRDLVRGVRGQLPPILAQLVPVWLLTIPPDLWTVVLVHEQFHAFQAISSPDRFGRALDAYDHEASYPYGDEAFANGWTAEGEALREALDAPSPVEACAAGRQFVEARRARREAAGLDRPLIAFEQELEWLEGLAKHAEMRVHEAASDAGEEGYATGLPHWGGEIGRLGSGLAEADGDSRFYLSGMAQARLLDRVAPGWTSRASLETLVLEESVAASCP